MARSSYRAPWWLPNRHLQTVYPTLVLRPQPPAYRRVEWNTPDGDFLDVDWVDGPAGAPLIVLFHGLEGHSRSPYAAAMMRAVRDRGWRGVVPHFRGCGGRPNRLPRAYHSGDADEVDWILRRLRGECEDPLFAAGVSLGGNALLKWLGREGAGASSVVGAAAAVSAPLDLQAAGPALGRGLNRMYTREFLRTLIPKTRDKLGQQAHGFDLKRILAATDFETFDDAYTAPAHGFADVNDYWKRASSKPDLPRIAVPTLVLNARNGPFLPARHLPGSGDVSDRITLDQPQAGGHVGFVSGPFPGNLSWLTGRVLDFFAVHLVSG